MPWKTTSCSASTRQLFRELCWGGVRSCIWWKESQTPPNKQGSCVALFHTSSEVWVVTLPVQTEKKLQRLFLNEISCPLWPYGSLSHIMNFNKPFRSRLSRSFQPVIPQFINSTTLSLTKASLPTFCVLLGEHSVCLKLTLASEGHMEEGNPKDCKWTSKISGRILLS